MAEGNRLVDSVEVTENKVHIIHLKSVYDASTVEEFEQVLEYLISNSYYRFVIDLARVEFVSSAGWGVFVGELQKLRDNNGDIKLTGMSSEVHDVFLLLELDMFIKAYDTVDDALSDFARNIIGVQAPVINKDGLKKKEQQRQNLLEAVETNKMSIVKSNSSNHDAAVTEKGVASSTDNKRTRNGILAEDADAIDIWSEGAEEIETGEFREIDITPPPQPPKLIQPPKEELPAPARNGLTGKSDNKKNNIEMSERHLDSDVFNLEFFKGGEHADAFDFSSESADEIEEAPANGNPFSETSTLGSAELQDDPMLEKIISVVIANPSYGPSAIRSMLINMNLAGDVLTRSDVYKKLVEVDLNTRAKRIAFARANAIE